MTRVLRIALGALLMTTAVAAAAAAHHGADSPCGAPDLQRGVRVGPFGLQVAGWTDPDGCVGASVASPGFAFAGDAQCGAEPAPLPLGLPGSDWVATKFEPIPRAFCASAGIVPPL